jgi:hypothetical protein
LIRCSDVERCSFALLLNFIHSCVVNCNCQL